MLHITSKPLQCVQTLVGDILVIYLTISNKLKTLHYTLKFVSDMAAFNHDILI